MKDANISALRCSFLLVGLFTVKKESGWGFTNVHKMKIIVRSNLSPKLRFILAAVTLRICVSVIAALWEFHQFRPEIPNFTVMLTRICIFGTPYIGRLRHFDTHNLQKKAFFNIQCIYTRNYA